MTQTMLYVDGARIRMPLVCTVISVLVWTVCAAICFASWLLATTSETNESAIKQPDSYTTESRGRPGRRF